MNFKIKRLTRKYCKMIFLLICLLQLTFINFAFAEEASTDETNSKGFLAISASYDTKSFDMYKIHIMNSEWGIEGGIGGFIAKGIVDDSSEEVYGGTGIAHDEEINIYTLGFIKRFKVGYMGLGYSWLNYSAKSNGTGIIPGTGSTVYGHGTAEWDMSTVDLFGGMSDRAGAFFYDFRLGYRYGINSEMKFKGTGEGDSGSYTDTVEIDDINMLEGFFSTISIGFAF
ncbi:MAG: hypothetical protein QUS13_02725 [Smithella sp.]|nr:hypothetical protein [Smithella sp.]